MIDNPHGWPNFRDIRIGECIHGNNMVSCIQCQRDRNPLPTGAELEKLIQDVQSELECHCRPNDPQKCLKHPEPGAGACGQGNCSNPCKEIKMDAKKAPNLTGYYDIDLFLDECLETMRVKGHDYRQGNDADLLHNFRTVAQSVDTSMMKVWFTYFYKHYSAMVTFIKEGGQSESEPIEGRIKDQIVYLLLFYRMVQEKKRVDANDTFPVSTKFPHLNRPGIEDEIIDRVHDEFALEIDRDIIKDLQERERKQEQASPPVGGIFLGGTRAAEVLEVPVDRIEIDMKGRPAPEPGQAGALTLNPRKMQELAGLRKSHRQNEIDQRLADQMGEQLSEIPENILTTAVRVTKALREIDQDTVLPSIRPGVQAGHDPELDISFTTPAFPLSERAEDMKRAYAIPPPPKEKTGDKLEPLIPSAEERRQPVQRLAPEDMWE